MIPIGQFVNQLMKSVALFQPESALIITFLVALLADLIFRKSKNISGIIALIGFAVTAYYLYMQGSVNDPAFTKMLAVDPFAKAFKLIILLASIIVVVISFFSDELYKAHERLGEYFTLIVGMVIGMFLLTGATNLILIYLAIETMSISSYILTGYTKEIKRASEASLKYVIFGAVSSGLMLYGISIIYGLTGSLNLYEINTVLATGKVGLLPLLISSLMIIAGIGYKISAVPFHFWTPDVYEGAPVTITALLSIASKAAGFAILIRFLKVGFLDQHLPLTGIWMTVGNIDWRFIIAVLSVLTMTLGNLVALWQTNVKRLLAYSSIAHAGYLLMGVTIMTDAGVSAILVYFVVYLFMNLTAFYIVMLFANKLGSEDIEDYTGIGYRAPILSVCLAICLVGLTGLPPTSGFIGKWMLFLAVIDAHYVWLAVVGVLNSVISLVYYVKIFRNMYLRDVDSKKPALKYSPASIIILLILTLPTLALGVYFSPIIEWANRATTLFLGK
ncbi:MAG: NADH-quinone oxidoreductase subunit N [FCB group bacterium]|jgi:NADH-quinone oxidoreductase subunit N